MSLQERDLLQSELAELKLLLQRTPESAVIDRASIQARLQTVEERLQRLSSARRPQPVILTFDGPPVVRASGIFADFGTKATSKFVEAITALAASLNQSLGRRGVIPNRDEYRLLIRDVVRGSFGFEFEEHVGNAALDTQGLTAVEQAVENTRALLQASLGSDEELTAAIADSSPRAVANLREFLKIVGDHDAVCQLRFRDKTFAFRDASEVRRSAMRLEEDNVKTTDHTFRGTFLGVLPIQRSFEFRIEDSGEVLRGRISPELEDPDAINRVLHRVITIEVQSIQVGEGAPRHVLVDYRMA